MARKYPPGPPNGLLGLSHIAGMRNELVPFSARLQRDYGDVVSFRSGPLRFYQLTHPEHVQEVLVKKAKKFHKPRRLKQVFGKWEGNGLVVSDGDYWARQRRLVQPAFQPARIAQYAEDMVQFTRAMLDGWGADRELNIGDEITRLTLQIVVKALFGGEVAEDADRIREAVETVQEVGIWESGRIFLLPDWVPLPIKRRGRRAIGLLKAMTQRMIRQGRATQGDRNDLLSILLTAVDAEGDGRRMTDVQAQDEIMTLLLAGHETTATALTWTTYLLARHPDVQERLGSHVAHTLAGTTPTFADLGNLVPIELAFKEAMRLYPPVYFMSREAAATVEIAGHQIPSGSQVHILPYLLHHDRRWFADPERFDPDRFSTEREASLPPCAYIPFGAGPRACVGRGFAMAEGVLILAAVLQRYNLSLAQGQGEPEAATQISLHPKGGIRLRVTRRLPALAAAGSA
jgi:cytochrome P450